jgi:GTP-binding protein Era
LFVDTPGIHHARDMLNRRMVERALNAMAEADVALWVVDAARQLGLADRQVASRVSAAAKPLVVALNKIDLVAKPALLPQIAALAALVPERPIVPVSAETGVNVSRLLDAVVSLLPEGPRYYPPEELTDEPERAIAAELIREQVMRQTEAEIPYAVAVTIDAFEEQRARGLIVIKATVQVARESHKPIVVGRGGARIKAIGQAARLDLERFLSTKVYLELFVRVDTGWNRRPARLRELDL